MKFISAGHCATQGPTFDSGAVGVNGRLEANDALRVRNRVIAILKERNITDIVQDADSESLGRYLARIQPGDASVTIEFHFDAFNGKATGTTGIISGTPTENSRHFARTMASITSRILGIPRRGEDGIITEKESNRGRLGLMREAGTVCLLEVCFIDNAEDMKKFDANFEALCQAYATKIQDFDDLMK